MPPRSDDTPSPAGHRSRLRHRFAQTGFNGFAPHEVVELLLTLAIPRRDVKPLAKLLIQRFGSLKGVLDADPRDLQEIDGMGEASSLVFRLVREAADLYLQQGIERGELLQSGTDIEAYYRHRLGGLQIEVFEVAYLDHANRLIPNAFDRVEEGDFDSVYIYPRRILETALRKKASGILLVHNHPTGRAQPSGADIQLTRQLQLAAKPLELRIVDHLIIAGQDVYSFRRAGVI
ncbi:MAG: DNA repair protein RadC [Verrucomicrobiota bacterium JB022]|nr:DNA repair protein RadC [Verrucomicrobiota bacterium JB022]